MRARVASGVATGSRSDVGSEEPMMGEYKPLNSVMIRHWYERMEDQASRQLLVESAICAVLDGGIPMTRQPLKTKTTRAYPA